MAVCCQIDAYFCLVSIERGRGQGKYLCLKLIEIVILLVYYNIPFGFNLFWHLLVITFQLLKLHCLAKDH